MFKKILILISIPVIAYTGNSDPDIKSADLIEHIKYLSSDELGGRFPGTSGDSLTQEYIIKHFNDLGLKPGGDDGFRQRFSFISSVKTGPANELQIGSDKLKLGSDWMPVYLSSSGVTVSGEVVFAAYGINAPELNYNDYEGLDVKGKIVLILMNSPGFNNPHDNPFGKYERIRVKSEEAKKQGAAGILLIKGPMHGDDELLPPRMFGTGDGAGIPVATIKREIILKYINGNLSDIQREIDETRKPLAFNLNVTVNKFSTELIYDNSTTANIIGVLEGIDPILKNEYIVVGAHMDHLGDGTSYGSLHSSDIPEIHNGADDNASGTAGILELAEYFSTHREKLKRSIIFMLFAAEEAGLIGSAHFVKSPLAAGYNIISMINMDMIGRLNDNKLTIGGTGTSSVWENLLDSLNQFYTFKTTYNRDGFGPSDHSSFYAKDIPVLFFFTGLHSEYHRPTDDWHLINSEGSEKIIKMVSDVISYLANNISKPDLIKSQTTSQNLNRTFRVTLGVIPDYSSSETGLEITGVKQGSLAEKIGLKSGDIIIKLGDYDIKNIYDYTDAISRFKPGDETEISVKRNNEVTVIKLAFPK